MTSVGSGLGSTAGEGGGVTLVGFGAGAVLTVQVLEGGGVTVVGLGTGAGLNLPSETVREGTTLEEGVVMAVGSGSEVRLETRETNGAPLTKGLLGSISTIENLSRPVVVWPWGSTRG